MYIRKYYRGKKPEGLCLYDQILERFAEIRKMASML
jgi:hypothetical protein